jgi:redox-sensitive bicupin YhaK (pirin superfamily)
MQTIKSEPIASSRSIEFMQLGQATSDGAGVKLQRVLTSALQSRLDPFLMLDAFGSDKPDDYIAGFPDHPHRGFETITYMLEGHMLHQDSAGNKGLLKAGAVQWMTAGRGVVHSETPMQQAGRMEGFQLWLNLHSSDKMCEPWYCDLQSGQLPHLDLDNGAHVVVIAGAYADVPGAVTRDKTHPVFLDVHLPGGQVFAKTLPQAHNAFVYVYRGRVTVAGSSVPSGTMGVLDNAPDADGVQVQADGDARFLLIAGRPLNEPIVQYGPFVMNSHAQIRKAIEDFQSGRF